MGKQGQPRPPRDNGPDTDMCADGLWFARPGSATHKRLTQSVADPVPVANLTAAITLGIGSHSMPRLRRCLQMCFVPWQIQDTGIGCTADRRCINAAEKQQQLRLTDFCFFLLAADV